jgi:uncharacterized membrane protein
MEVSPMMHGFGWNGLSTTTGMSGVFDNGWMVMSMMGIGLLLVVGLVVLLIWTQRDAIAGAMGSSGEAAGHMPPRPMTPDADSAADIARHRYARGEIERDEYEDIMSVLRQS